MIEEYNNEVWTITYEPAHGIVHCQWKEAAADLDDERFMQEMLAYIEIVEKYQAPKLLLNLQGGNYTLIPEVQEWVANEIAPRAVKAGQNKIATLLSNDIFAQVATEQLMEEGVIATILQKYFDNAEEAKAWLIEA